MMTVTTQGINLQDQFAVEYGNNTFLISGSLEYGGNINITGSTRFDDLAAFNGKTFIERLGGRGDLNFEVSGELKNPDIMGRISSDSLLALRCLFFESGYRFQNGSFSV